jgi:hypothetical protein
MDKVQNCYSYINIPSSQTYRYQHQVFQNYYKICGLTQVEEMQTVVLHSQNIQENFQEILKYTCEKTRVRDKPRSRFPLLIK